MSYTHPANGQQSAARLVRYVSRRPQDRALPGPESTWSELPEDQQWGNKEAFKEEANRRTRERRETAERRGKDLSKNKALSVPSYLHVILSPDPERSAEYENEDFGALVEEWTRDEDNPWFAAVHYDEPDRPHVHLMIARDQYRPTELEEKLNDADRAAAVREQTMGLDVNPQVAERLGWSQAVEEERAGEELDDDEDDRRRRDRRGEESLDDEGMGY